MTMKTTILFLSCFCVQAIWADAPAVAKVVAPVAATPEKQPVKDSAGPGTKDAADEKNDSAPSITAEKAGAGSIAVEAPAKPGARGEPTQKEGVVQADSAPAQVSTLATVANVDLNKYLGEWYEIARFDNEHQQGCEDSKAVYTQKSDYIEIKNSCMMAGGKKQDITGRLKTSDLNTSNAKLKVNFTPLFIRIFGVGWGDYWIIDLGANYEYAVVSGPSRAKLWILSRQKPMNNEMFAGILKRLQEKGFDTSKLLIEKGAVVQ